MNEPEIITRAERLAQKKTKKGLGDIVGSIATPIAGVLKMPCVDPQTKQLRPNSPCAKRKEKLNKISDALNGFAWTIINSSKE